MNNKLMTHSEVKEILFKKDSKLKRVYDALAPRYELISNAIDARIKKKNDPRRTC